MMRLRFSALEEDDKTPVEDARFAALTYLAEAWDEAQLDGLPTECVAHAAIFRAISELVSLFGEEATATFADKLGDKIRAGEYSLPTVRQ